MCLQARVGYLEKRGHGCLASWLALRIRFLGLTVHWTGLYYR